MRRFWHDVREPWEGLLVDVEAVEQHGDLAFVRFRFRARGRDGMAVDARFFQVGEVGTDGLVRRIDAYVDEERARRRLESWHAQGG
jgi:hypothetical protein